MWIKKTYKSLHWFSRISKHSFEKFDKPTPIGTGEYFLYIIFFLWNKILLSKY